MSRNLESIDVGARRKRRNPRPPGCQAQDGASLLTENFNGLTVGALNGQASWSGSALFLVQTGTVQEGANACAASGVTADVACTKTFTATSGIAASWYMRSPTPLSGSLLQISIDSNLGAHEFQFDFGGATGAELRFFNRSGGTWDAIQAASANTWYLVQVDIRSGAGTGTNSLYDICVDNIRQVLGISPRSGFVTASAIRLYRNYTATGDPGFIDNILVTNET